MKLLFHFILIGLNLGLNSHMQWVSNKVWLHLLNKMFHSETKNQGRIPILLVYFRGKGGKGKVLQIKLTKHQSETEEMEFPQFCFPFPFLISRC